MTVYNHLAKTVTPLYLTVRKDETNLRCPICGDSTKSTKSAHMYIQNKPPFKFYCQKCGSTGIVDDKFLLKFNANSPDMNSYLSNSQLEYQMELNRKYGSSLTNYTKKEEFKILPNQYGDLEKRKMDYIANRISRETITKDEIKKFRIILNLFDFYTNNGIETSNMTDYQKKKLDDLNKNYVMFLLHDNNLISCRHMNPSNKKEKFYKLRIFDNDLNTSTRFFSIVNKIDLTNRVFNIHMSEGIFDILSVYYNLMDQKIDDNTLYLANNGTGYLFVLEYIQSLSILNANINIYCDNDLSIDKLKKSLRNSSLIKFNEANIYYNTYGEGVKDFGVTKDKIKVSAPFILRV